MTELSSIKQVKNPVIKSKIVETKEDGVVVDRELVTTVSFDYTGSPAKLSDVLYTLTAGNQVDVVFNTAQGVLATVLDSSGKKTKLDKNTGELMPAS
jgi:hypothetical protein